jgi:hypothetical protein
MRLMLHYRGLLRPNGTPAHKQDLRRTFHGQLKTLWGQKLLSEAPNLLKLKVKKMLALFPLVPVKVRLL